MTRKKAIACTMLAWAIISGLYAHYYVKSTLALPNLSKGYESDWEFQLLMFCIFRLPILMVGLIATLTFEIWTLKGESQAEK